MGRCFAARECFAADRMRGRWMQEPEAGNGRELVEPMTVLSTGAGVERWNGGRGCVPAPGRSAAGRGVAGWGVTGLYTGITFMLLMRRATSKRLISRNSLQDAGTTNGAPAAAVPWLRSTRLANASNAGCGCCSVPGASGVPPSGSGSLRAGARLRRSIRLLLSGCR